MGFKILDLPAYVFISYGVNDEAVWVILIAVKKTMFRRYKATRWMDKKPCSNGLILIVADAAQNGKDELGGLDGVSQIIHKEGRWQMPLQCLRRRSSFDLCQPLLGFFSFTPFSHGPGIANFRVLKADSVEKRP
jgi:hypothetical protein